MALFQTIPIPHVLCNGAPDDASSSVLTANTAYFTGVWNPTTTVLTALRIYIALGGNGNYDVGIYDSGGNLLNNQGALATSTGIKTYTLATPLGLSPGRYWLAYWVGNALDQYGVRSGFQARMAVAQSVSASNNLPATMSGTANVNQLPLILGLLQGGWS